jgi:hypothetical protein
MNTKEALALWKKAKEVVQNGLESATEKELEEVRKTIPTMSPISFMSTKLQMKALGLEGIPGLDTKTLAGWKKFGFLVKKGEHSQLKGITFVEMENKQGDEYIAPRMYHLFHSSQVVEDPKLKAELEAENTEK